MLAMTISSDSTTEALERFQALFHSCRENGACGPNTTLILVTWLQQAHFAQLLHTPNAVWLRLGARLCGLKLVLGQVLQQRHYVGNAWFTACYGCPLGFTPPPILDLAHDSNGSATSSGKRWRSFAVPRGRPACAWR
jgi:hypothetical protein